MWVRHGVKALAAGGALLAVVSAPAWADTIEGTDADERLVGTPADDTIRGFGGNDHIEGGPGFDILMGDEGADEIHGQEGNDEIYGGKGADSSFGGDGPDYFQVAAGADDVHGGPGSDLIEPFTDGQVDLIYCGGGDDLVTYWQKKDKLDEYVGCESVEVWS